MKNGSVWDVDSLCYNTFILVYYDFLPPFFRAKEF